MKKKLFLLILVLTLLLSGCGQPYVYQVPEELGDGWETASLEEVGINERLIAKAVERIRDNTYPNVHSLLIAKDGKLVFEEYFGGYEWVYDSDRFQGPYKEFDRDSLHTIMSVTKAFTSALVGIAVDQGFIANEHEKVFDYFPEYAHLRDEPKNDITLEHLLTMTSGLEWNEWEYSLSDTRNDLIQLFIVNDPMAYILAKPVVHQPGTYWYYSGGDVNLLGETIRKATGMRMDDFAAQYLFSPLGITEYEWDFINPNVVHASGNLKLHPRGMAKFGYLILNDDVWQGERILSQAWVDKTKTAYISSPAPDHGERYGYQWWLKTFPYGSGTVEALHRSGWGGQAIYLFPSLDMVVVFTDGNYVGEIPNNEIITRYILPAAR
jgi:CubicO group peptidase (beta-lactamase class C family)